MPSPNPPRKRFGQHFLVARPWVGKIIAAIAPVPGDNIVEIGPGEGALTRSLIDGCAHLTAIEIDRDLAAQLAVEFPAERLTLHVADALDFDLATLGPALRIVGNLPYNISTPLLFHFAKFEGTVRDITVMLQKEVVARMVAAPATPDYGRLTVMLQARFALKRLMVIPPGAFRPPPKVESAVVRLTPLGAAKPSIVDFALFARVVAAAFGTRRKTLRNALASLADADTLRAADIDPGRRGETLAVADFVRLANRLSGG